MYRATDHILLLDILKEIKMKHGTLGEPYSLIFITRLGANFSVLRDLFLSLYGQQENCEKRFRQLILKLYSNFKDRPECLKQLDTDRERDHNWLLDQQWVGMTMYTEHFAGNLSGFQAHIPYLEELGINLVHLMPLLESPPGENDGGYAVSDYKKVNPQLGSMADIRAITQEFRNRNMLLVLDLVLNHTSHKHKWAQNALNGKKKYQDYYYMFPDRSLPDQYEAHMPEVFPTSAPGNFTYSEELDKWVMTVFHGYQWDLNYHNPEVLMEITDVLFYLANQGVDIIRLDAPAYLWKELGTSCQNLPQTHSVLKLLKRCAEVVAPGVKFIAEAIVAPHEITKYYGSSQDHECDIAYHATLMALIWDSLATGKVALLNRSINNLPSKPMGTTWINYVRCHDDIGLGIDNADIYAVGFNAGMHRKFLLEYYTGEFQGSLASGALFMYNPISGDARISGTLASLAGLERSLESGDQRGIDQSLKKIILANAIIMSFGGLPMIYSGDEIGQLNDYSYQKDPGRVYDNRWMHRPAMDWEAAKKRKKNHSIQSQIFTALQNLIAIRKESPDWADYNNVELLHCENQHVLAFQRTTAHFSESSSERTLVVANFHPELQLINKNLLYSNGYNPEKVLDRYTKKPLQYQKHLLVLQPYQFCFIKDIR